MANLVGKMSRYFALERSQVVGKWENRDRKRVPEFTSERDERVKILVNSCISKVEKQNQAESSRVLGMKD